MDLQTAYSVLGIEPSAPATDVRRAYLELVKVWHPDRFPGDVRVQTRASSELKRINEAYAVIRGKQSARFVPTSPPRPSQSPPPQQERPPTKNEEESAPTEGKGARRRPKAYRVAAYVAVASFCIVAALINPRKANTEDPPAVSTLPPARVQPQPEFHFQPSPEVKAPQVDRRAIQTPESKLNDSLTRQRSLNPLSFHTPPDRHGRGETVFLTSGRTLPVKGHRISGDSVILLLRSGGEVKADVSVIEKIVPDESKEVTGYSPPSDTATGASDDIPAQIEKIKNAQHGEPPRPEALRTLGSGPTTYAVTNLTQHVLTVLLTGPSNQRLVLQPAATQTITVTPGEYEVAGSVGTAGVIPFYGRETLDTSTQYTIHFIIERKW